MARSVTVQSALVGALVILSSAAASARAATILVEAEGFTDHGGWTLDTQFIGEMGSPYLVAHGLGRPVADATTTITVPEASKALMRGRGSPSKLTFRYGLSSTT